MLDLSPNVHLAPDRNDITRDMRVGTDYFLSPLVIMKQADSGRGALKQRTVSFRQSRKDLFSEKPKHLPRGEIGEAQGEIGHAGVPVLENPVTTLSRIANERGLEKRVARAAKTVQPPCVQGAQGHRRTKARRTPSRLRHGRKP